MCLNQSMKENVKLSVRFRWTIQLDKIIVAITFTITVLIIRLGGPYTLDNWTQVN